MFSCCIAWYKSFISGTSHVSSRTPSSVLQTRKQNLLDESITYKTGFVSWMSLVIHDLCCEHYGMKLPRRRRLNLS